MVCTELYVHTVHREGEGMGERQIHREGEGMGERQIHRDVEKLLSQFFRSKRSRGLCNCALCSNHDFKYTYEKFNYSRSLTIRSRIQ